MEEYKKESIEGMYDANYVENYDQEFTFAQTIKCYTDCDMSKDNMSILEVGCGTGIHALHAVKTMMGNNSYLAIFDLSKPFVDMATGHFEKSDFTKT